MPLSSSTIVDLATSRPNAARVGRVTVYQREAAASPGLYSQAELELLAQLAAEPLAPIPPKYSRPDVDAHAQAGRRPAGPLSASELQWLAALPKDAAEVPYGDAVALGVLALTVPQLAHAADHRLVERHYLPVREHHQREAAKVELEALRAPIPAPPPATAKALAVAILREVGELTPQEAAGRSEPILRDALANRASERDRAIYAAEQRIREADDAAARRNSVTKLEDRAAS